MKKALVFILMTTMFLTACGTGKPGEIEQNTQEETKVDKPESTGSSIDEDQTDAIEFTEDNVPIFRSWTDDPSLMDTYGISLDDSELKYVRFWGYEFLPDELLSMPLADMVYEILSHTEGSFVFNISHPNGYLSADEDHKKEYIYFNTAPADLTKEDIQADLSLYAAKAETAENYSGYAYGTVCLYNENDLAIVLIQFKTYEGIVIEKELKFLGDEESTIDQHYTNFMLRNKSADYEIQMDENSGDILVDHSKDGLYILDYKIDVLEQYGLDVTINEMQWEEEPGNSDLRINFTFINNTNVEIDAYSDNKLVLNTDGEEVNTFLVWAEEIPAGETYTFDINVKNLSNTLESVQFGFRFSAGIDRITTDIVVISGFTDEQPTITFSGEMIKVDEDYLEKIQ